MRSNKKGFTIVAALAAASILAGLILLSGKILAYVKSKRVQTQVRLSSLGYEDWMANSIAEQIVTPNCAAINIQNRPVPGTAVNLVFANLSSTPSVITVTGCINRADCGAPITRAEGKSSSERFIDNPSRIEFRIEYISKAMSTDVKVFGPFLTCEIWRALPLDQKQLKISYNIRRFFRDRELNQFGSKIINTWELQ